MTIANAALSAVMRRRAATLREDGCYSEQWLGALERAADVLEALARHELGDALVEAVGDNRRLRGLFVRVVEAVKTQTLSLPERKVLIEMIHDGVAIQHEPGKGAWILNVEVLPDHQRADVEAHFKAALDRAFARAASRENSLTITEEPEDGKETETASTEAGRESDAGEAVHGGR